MNTNNKGNKSTFADNIMNNRVEILQLLLSEAIWKRKNVSPDQLVYVSTQEYKPMEGVTRKVFYLDKKPVLMVSQSNGEVDGIPSHYTICI